MKMPENRASWKRVVQPVSIGLFLAFVPLLVASKIMHLGDYDLSVPFRYVDADGIWQLVLSKMLFDTGWILDNPYLGAPDIAHWHGNASAQTSALHSVLMLGIKPFVPDAVAMQQVYYLINFSLIAATSYISARLIGIGRWTSCCIGLLFCFAPWRYNALYYAYLPNYFIIPLSILPPVWLLAGRMAGSWRAMLLSRALWASMLIIILSATTDGYYAFFTLLLLGFAGGIRSLAYKDIRSLAATVLLIIALIATASALAWPLRSFEHAHQAEFLVDGKPDPALAKQPFEAEVYASSLKLMVAPIVNNRVPQLATLGKWMLETSNRARSFPGAAGISLGTFGSLLLISAFACMATGIVYARPLPRVLASRTTEFGAILALVLFSFLCATAGGIGSLVALVYPTIRAYNRFPLYTMFLLFLAAGLVFQSVLDGGPRRWKLFGRTLSLVFIPLAIFDQMPPEIGWRNPVDLAQYAAEKKFIHKIESAVPDRTEIYQYPYSNYLIDSPYYGWGAFAHVRFYLHSHHLRWSNGAFKNSPVDKWDMRMAALPLDQLVMQVRAAGFGGVLVDRTVVGDAEYNRVRDELVAQTGTQPVLDEASRLAFWRLPPLGYHIVYDPDYLQPTEVVVDDPQAITPNDIARSLDPKGFLQAVAASASQPGKPFVIERSAHPEAFSDTRIADAGLGLVPLQPPFLALQADVLCPTAPRPISADDMLTLTVHNRSPVEIRFNSGPAPLRVGLQQLVGADGAQVRADGGYRVPGSPSIKPGASITLKVPLADLDLRKGLPATLNEITAVFALVQEGVTWLASAQGDGECRIPLRLRSVPAE